MNTKIITKLFKEFVKQKTYETNRLLNTFNTNLNRNTKQFLNYSSIRTNIRINNKCFELIPKRGFSDRPEDSEEPNDDRLRTKRHLMSFKPILLPNVWYKWKNFLTIHTIIRPFFDNEFTLEKFMFGAKQALVHISGCLADGNTDSLKGLITDEAMTEIRQNLPLMSAKQLQELRVNFEDIIYCFPFRIGILMNENDDKRWVEITVIFYSLYKYQTLMDPNLNEKLSYKEFSEKFGKNITVCNYRFIRDYTKGIDSEWTVNLLGHFQESGAL